MVFYSSVTKLLAVQEGLYATDLVGNNVYEQHVSMLSTRFSAHELLKAINCENFMQFNQNKKSPAASMSHECEVQIKLTSLD